MRRLNQRRACAVLMLIVAACGGNDTEGGGGSKGTGDGPCEAASECAGDVCVAVIDLDHPPVYCSETCSATSCPSGFWCDDQTFSLIGLRYCRFGDTPTTEPPAEPPRLPCKSDADCDGDQVCAESGGARGCTITCAAEPDCTPPPLGGFTFDYLRCAADEGNAARQVCLPDPACFTNPLACTTSP